MAKLTTKSVEAIKPGKVRREVPDALLVGLYLIVQTSGVKSWAVRYRFGGANRKHTLGRWPRIDLAEARDLARTALRAVAEGRDPAAERKATRAAAAASDANTVDGMFAQFLAEHVMTRKGAAIRPRHKNESARLLGYKSDGNGGWTPTGNGVLAAWQGRPVASISSQEVRDLVKGIAKERPILANRVLSAVKTAFQWRVDLDSATLPISPADSVKKQAPEVKRDRWLDDREVSLVWRAAGKLAWPFGPITQLLMLTGARRNEVAGMQWSEIDLEAATWSLPASRAKNNHAHQVPLSRQASEIIKALPRVDDRLVFTTNGKRPVSGFDKAKRRLDALLPANMQPFVSHDLRRSFVTGLARLGVSLPVIERAVNHQSGVFRGIVSTYQLHDYAAEVRAALQKWADHIDSLARNGGQQ